MLIDAGQRRRKRERRALEVDRTPVAGADVDVRLAVGERRGQKMRRAAATEIAERAADGMFRGPHTLHGRLCPTRPDKVSAPCAKFDSIPAKLQQAKLPRIIVLKTHALKDMLVHV